MRSRTFSALLGCVAALAFSAAPANAVPASPEPEPSALVRGAHFSPDTPAVDVYLTDAAGGNPTKALSNVSYGDVSKYQRIKSGSYTVSMRPAGADPSTPAAISWTLDAKPDSVSTAMAIGMNQHPQARVLSDDLTPPPTGQALVRVIQASERAKTVDVTADNGLVLASKVPFADITDYTTVPAGSWPITTRSVDNRDITTGTDVTLKAGGANTVVVLDDVGQGISMRVVDDALGTDLPPIGPPETGDGATAMPDVSPRRVALWGFSGVMTLAAAVVLFGFRRAGKNL
jgi:hypothetical protein